ncbi:MAG: ABC transporter substrate-binding protein [Thermodesulfobacteriota bacterium]
MKRTLRRIASSAAMLVLLAVPALAQEISIGMLADLSGPTADVGTPYADGLRDGAKYINEAGLLGAAKLKFTLVDYAYNAQQALSAYKKFVSQDNILFLQGWGTQDTEALTQFVAKDKIPTISASYSAHLTDPAKAPYNFFIAADYSTQVRAALKYFRDNWKESRAPRLALCYPNVPYGLASIPPAKEYAKELGFELAGEEIVDLKAMDATAQLLRLAKAAPDFTWIGGTTQSTAVILKDAQKLGFKTQFFTNIWGADENLVPLAGPAAEGVISLQAAVVYGQDVPGMKAIEKITGGKPQMTHYVRGFASMLVMAEGIKRAQAKGKLGGEEIKAALETLRDFDPMGLTLPISYFPDDHRPNMSVFLYAFKGGKLELVAKQSLERKKEWLGK